MDKNTFMKELEQSLSVLQESELKDILSEYEQHIDMKVESGLSEEDAIADFGGLPELTAEILEAYHVRADYAADYAADFAVTEKRETKIAVKKMQNAKEMCSNCKKAAVRGIYGFGHWFLGVLVFWKRQLGRPFVWGYGIWKKRSEQTGTEDARMDEEVSGIPENMEEERKQKTAGLRNGTGMTKERRKKMVVTNQVSGCGRVFRRLADMTGSCVSFGVQIILWGMRMIWNAGWICFSVICGISGLFCLFGLGLLAVLLLQHYPMTGVTIGCVGLTCCLFSAAGLGLTFLWRKEKRANDVTGSGTSGRGEEMPADRAFIDTGIQDAEQEEVTERCEQFHRGGGERYA